ncbi:hypothetical protein IS858_001051 [Staphylococcus pseudintermedius]|nr:hypothetical protein [Staphylococcus pseudintermedius]
MHGFSIFAKKVRSFYLSQYKMIKRNIFELRQGMVGDANWMHMWSGQGGRLAQNHDVANFFNQLIQNAQSQAE